MNVVIKAGTDKSFLINDVPYQRGAYEVVVESNNGFISIVRAGAGTIITKTALSNIRGGSGQSFATFENFVNYIEPFFFRNVAGGGGGGGNVTASNGLKKTGEDIQLGGTLTEDTTIIGGGNALTLNLEPSLLNLSVSEFVLKRQTSIHETRVTGTSVGQLQLRGSSSVQVNTNSFVRSSFKTTSSLTNLEFPCWQNVQEALTSFSPTLEDGSVTTVKLADSSVSNTKIADNSISAPKLQDGSVVNAKIGDLAVSEAKIGNSAVTTDKIGNSAVTTAKIADGSVTTAKYANTSITGNKIGNLQITGVKLANATITEDKLAFTIPQILKQTSVIDQTAWNTNDNNTKTVTVTGASVGDNVLVNVSASVYSNITTQGVRLIGSVTSANTVRVIGRADSFLAIPSGSEWIITVFK